MKDHVDKITDWEYPLILYYLVVNYMKNIEGLLKNEYIKLIYEISIIIIKSW